MKIQLSLTQDVTKMNLHHQRRHAAEITEESQYCQCQTKAYVTFCRLGVSQYSAEQYRLNNVAQDINNVDNSSDEHAMDSSTKTHKIHVVQYVTHPYKCTTEQQPDGSSCEKKIKDLIYDARHV